MATWAEFESAAPEIAEAGRKLLYQHGLGLAFLATVRPDGGPRLHPFCPVVAAGGLWGLIAPSPKREDLLRNGRYAIHAFPPEKVDDEFYVTGTARQVTDEAKQAAVFEAYDATPATRNEDELLFEFHIDRVLLAEYETRPQWPPRYRKWKAG